MELKDGSYKLRTGNLLEFTVSKQNFYVKRYFFFRKKMTTKLQSYCISFKNIGILMHFEVVWGGGGIPVIKITLNYEASTTFLKQG